MTEFSQKDPAWKYTRFSPANLSIGSYGCFLTSLACLLDKDPPTVAQVLDNFGCFDSQGYLNSDCAARILNLEYNGKTTDYQTSVCIAETGDYASVNYPQHFFVWLGNGHIIDPLLGYETVNNYNIKSFRLFRLKGVSMPEQCFASREMNVGKIKEQLIYIRERLYALQPLTNKEYQERAERVADDNINLVGILKDEVKTDFFKYFMRKKDCVCPPDLSLELTETRRREKDNWDNLVKTMDERDKAEAELELCQKKVCPPCKQDCDVKVYEVCNGKEAKRIISKLYWIK